jgi:hypothetical protein
MGVLMSNLILDPTEPAWATALVIFEALAGADRARFLLGDYSSFESIMKAAEASGVPVRHANGKRLNWRRRGRFS